MHSVCGHKRLRPFFVRVSSGFGADWPKADMERVKRADQVVDGLDRARDRKVQGAGVGP